MFWAFLARAVAEAEDGLRVRARRLKVLEDGEARRASMTAPPCLPVAPVMRMFFIMLDMVVCMVELERRVMVD